MKYFRYKQNDTMIPATHKIYKQIYSKDLGPTDTVQTKFTAWKYIYTFLSTLQDHTDLVLCISYTFLALSQTHFCSMKMIELFWTENTKRRSELNWIDFEWR
jgi:cytosine/uracil/thiamine/allantoin permease